MPFFAYVALYPPHAQALWPAGPAIDEDDQPCPDIAPHRPPSYALQDDRIEKMDNFRKLQLCSMPSIDRAVAQLLAGIPENTLVIFTSDNGHHWGEHGPYKKATAWDESTRVPLVIRHPSIGGPPSIDEPVGLIDLAPTILDAAGISEAGKRIDGRSIMPLLDGTASRWRSRILIELDGRADVATAIRTKIALYIERPGGNELYLLGPDPYAIDNVVDDPSQSARVARLSRQLERLRNCAGPGCP